MQALPQTLRTSAYQAYRIMKPVALSIAYIAGLMGAVMLAKSLWPLSIGSPVLGLNTLTILYSRGHLTSDQIGYLFCSTALVAMAIALLLINPIGALNAAMDAVYISVAASGMGLAPYFNQMMAHLLEAEAVIFHEN